MASFFPEQIRMRGKGPAKDAYGLPDNQIFGHVRIFIRLQHACSNIAVGRNVEQQRRNSKSLALKVTRVSLRPRVE
eukprot:6217835-Amphidinium_carterae.2